MITHLLIVAATTLFVLTLFFVWGLCVAAKQADEAIAKAVEEFKKEKIQ